MKVLRVALAACAVWLPLALASAAHAQAPTEAEAEDLLSRTSYHRGGWYVGGEGLVAVDVNSEVGGSSHLVTGGFQMRLGKRHNRWLATELSGIYVDNFVENDLNRLIAWGMSVNERLYLSGGRVQPFLTVGLGFLQVRSLDPWVILPDGTVIPLGGFDPGFAPFFGAGLEIYTNESFALTVVGQYHLPVGNISGFDFVTAGLGFIFF